MSAELLCTNALIAVLAVSSLRSSRARRSSHSLESTDFACGVVTMPSWNQAPHHLGAQSTTWCWIGLEPRTHPCRQRRSVSARPGAAAPSPDDGSRTGVRPRSEAGRAERRVCAAPCGSDRMSCTDCRWRVWPRRTSPFVPSGRIPFSRLPRVAPACRRAPRVATFRGPFGAVEPGDGDRGGRRARARHTPAARAGAARLGERIGRGGGRGAELARGWPRLVRWTRTRWATARYRRTIDMYSSHGPQAARS